MFRNRTLLNVFSASEDQMYDDRAILVAEDDELIRAIMCEVLLEHGFQPVEAASTPAALALVDGRDDLCAAFIDIDLGDRGGGYEVARRMHAQRPGVKIVYTSGGPRGDFESERVEGALFVPKPYTPDNVCDLIAARLA
jgi:CheY-like chemotaxis protein